MFNYKACNCESIATKAPDVAPVLIPFNYDAHAKFEVANLTYPLPSYSVLLLIRYVMPVSYTHLTLPTIYSV